MRLYLVRSNVDRMFHGMPWVYIDPKGRDVTATAFLQKRSSFETISLERCVPVPPVTLNGGILIVADELTRRLEPLHLEYRRVIFHRLFAFPPDFHSRTYQMDHEERVTYFDSLPDVDAYHRDTSPHWLAIAPDIETAAASCSPGPETEVLFPTAAGYCLSHRLQVCSEMFAEHPVLESRGIYVFTEKGFGTIAPFLPPEFFLTAIIGDADATLPAPPIPDGPLFG